MPERTKNMLIGLFVLIASSLLVGMILFFEPSAGDAEQTLVVRFSDINGLTVGTRVRFAGKPVGEVVKIEQIKDARRQPTDEEGKVYFYQLILKVDSSVKVFNTDEITVQTTGLLGEKSIAIVPKAPPKGVKPKQITAATPVYAESIDKLESAFNEFAELADKAEEALDKVISWIDQNGSELGAAIKSFDDTMAETSIAMKKFNEMNLIYDIKDMVGQFTTSATQINHAFDDLFAQNTFHNMGIAIKNVKSGSYALNDVLESLSEGKGTLGLLLNKPDIYLQAGAILSKIDTLMNDVNHYGVFFNLNKQWQRTRTKQITFLNALRTPDQFRSYFQKEVDLINTSMSRLSLVVDRAENNKEREKIFKSTPFKRDFEDLLRLTNDLANNLKLYNEKLQTAEHGS